MTSLPLVDPPNQAQAAVGVGGVGPPRIVIWLRGLWR